MPTASKLVAGLCLAVMALVISQLVRPLWPEGTDFHNFDYWNALIGFLCGWILLGPRTGRGFAASISNGTTAAVMVVIWGVFVYATEEMVDRSFRRFYDSPFEAVAAIFELALEFGARIFQAEIILAVLAGGVISGLIAEIAGRRWS